jgi:hypothetical protein
LEKRERERERERERRRRKEDEKRRRKEKVEEGSEENKETTASKKRPVGDPPDGCCLSSSSSSTVPFAPLFHVIRSEGTAPLPPPQAFFDHAATFHRSRNGRQAPEALALCVEKLSNLPTLM